MESGTSNLKTSYPLGSIIQIVSAAVMLVSSFLNWAKFEFMGVSSTGNNAFDYPFRGLIPLVLILGLGIIAVIRLIGGSVGKFAPSALLLGASGAALFLLITLVVTGPDDAGVDLKPAVGLWLAIAAALIALGGSVIDFLGLENGATKMTEPLNRNAGWYLSADGIHEQYWNGQAWTDSYRTAQQGTFTHEGRPIPAPPPPSFNPYIPINNGLPLLQAPVHGPAVASMVLGIISLVLWYLGIITGVIGLVLGAGSLKHVQPRGPKRGRGMAIAGITCSIIALALWLLVLLAAASIGASY